MSIEARGLTKRYGEKTAVDGLTFTVKPGTVTGFLGPNGAGKSTTMRLIPGLDRPTRGQVTVAGKQYAAHRAPLREVGALLEARSVHTGRTAFKHLLALAHTHRIPRRRVDEVIEAVGLAAVARKRAGGFSLGMGQRLGIAAALLADPAASSRSASPSTTSRSAPPSPVWPGSGRCSPRPVLQIRFDPPDDVWRDYIPYAAVAATIAMAGITVRIRRAYIASLVERAERLEIERDHRAQLAAADEIGRLRQLHVRNTTLVAVSRAPYDKIAAFRDRMGWTFPWYSAYGSDFNYDFHATVDDRAAPVLLGFRTKAELAEAGTPWTESMRGDWPGISAFFRVGEEVFHTYSTFGRGLEEFHAGIRYPDLTALGRQEAWEEPKVRAVPLGLHVGGPALRLPDEYDT